jgi:ABC-type dipeptide/oligopeptide/nickel transport system ATPase component
MSEPLLSIKDLSVEFNTELGIVHALNKVTFDVPRDCITAVVGESGSGKSVTCNSIMRLLPKSAKTSGEIILRPQDAEPIPIFSLTQRDPRLSSLRGGLVSMVFQEPMTALSPVHRVGDQVAEAVLCHRRVSRKVASEEAATMLEKVGITDVEQKMRMYPFEFSGGMCQRAVIAMALICNPQLLICDEPTTALDVTIQAEILVLIKSLQRKLENSVLFITHDLGVVAQTADRVVVMYNGQVMEIGSVRQVLKTPLHPYTAHLLASLPESHANDSSNPRTNDWAEGAPVGSGTVLATSADGRQVREFSQ